MAKSNHVCKFKRLRYKSGNEVFFCTMPDCQKKMNPALCLGKRSICWRCGEEFILNEYSLRLAKPHCENCHKPKNQKNEIEETIPWVHEPTEIEKEAVKELIGNLSLAEKLTQTINAAKLKEKDEEL